ncbi:MAG: C39 family peptidase [Deltaproteobacteria bacterium]|jgi:predicted double-glycine peptidase|nr:C39 family peptidase [Deltaproteobacteria bacterium]
MFSVTKGILMAFLVLVFGGNAAVAGMIEFKAGLQGTVLRKPVKSMKEMRYEGIVRQRLDISCGTAALATVLKYYYGQDVSEEDVIADILNHGDREQIAQKGFSMLDLKRYTERMGGFRAEGYRVSFDSLKKLKLPSIVLLNLRGFNHFVVLRGVRGDRVFISDPIIGRRTINAGEFTDGWNGIVLLVLGKEQQFGNGDYFGKLQDLGVSKEEIWRIKDKYVGAPMLSAPFEIKNF